MHNLATYAMTSRYPPRHQQFPWDNGIWSDSSESPDPFESDDSSDSDEILFSVNKIVNERKEETKPSLRDYQSDKNPEKEAQNATEFLRLVKEEYNRKIEPSREADRNESDNLSHLSLYEEWDAKILCNNPLELTLSALIMILFCGKACATSVAPSRGYPLRPQIEIFRFRCDSIPVYRG